MNLQKILAVSLSLVISATQAHATEGALSVPDFQALQLAKASDDFESFKKTYAEHLRLKHSRFLYDVQNISEEEIQVALDTINIGEPFQVQSDNRKIDRVSSLVTSVLNDSEKKFLLLDSILQAGVDKVESRRRIQGLIVISASASSIAFSAAVWNQLIKIRSMQHRLSVYLLTAWLGNPVTLLSAVHILTPLSSRNVEDVHQSLFLKTKRDSLLEVLAGKAYVHSQSMAR
jgi:hypothetical protein